MRWQGWSWIGEKGLLRCIRGIHSKETTDPIRMRWSRVCGFTTKAISSWSQYYVEAGMTDITDGLACFVGVTEAECKLIAKIAGGRKPSELPIFQRLNTILGNVKTGISCVCKIFLFSKYSNRCFAESAYRSNRRFDLMTLYQRFLIFAVGCPVHPDRLLRSGILLADQVLP